jgi:hypothetical protein
MNWTAANSDPALMVSPSTFAVRLGGRQLLDEGVALGDRLVDYLLRRLHPATVVPSPHKRLTRLGEVTLGRRQLTLHEACRSVGGGLCGVAGRLGLDVGALVFVAQEPGDAGDVAAIRVSPTVASAPRRRRGTDRR